MANPVYRRYLVSDTVLGPQAPVNLDWLNTGQATLAVWLGGACTYSVEGTLDDVNAASQGGFDGEVPAPRWFTLNEFPVGTVASKYAFIPSPWLWVRINIASIVGPVEFKVQQASNTRGF